jgi:hypothetical protein
VHPVGDRGDRHLLDVEAGPQRLEHLPADHAVQLAHAVGPLGEPQAHVRHVEPAGVGLGSELEHPLDRERGPLRLLVVGPDQVLGEPVDAGRDRGVGGEHGAGAHAGQRLVEAEPVGGQLAHPLQAEEAGVALVGVEHLGRRRAGQPAVGPDRTHAADPGQHLLGHPVLAGAAVQLVGDLPLGGLVLLDVGVEQEQRHPPDLDLPDLGPQRAAAGDGEGDLHRGAVGLAQERQRQAVRVDRRVELLLPAVPGQPLGEVAGPVEQADADDRDAEVAGRLEVVAGQDAEATGVLREDLGQAELHREVGDAARHPGLLLVPARLGQVVGQVVGGVGEPAQEPLVPGQRGQPGRRYRAEQPDRVAATVPPQFRIDGREQVQRLLVPGPTQVHDEGRSARPSSGGSDAAR